MVGYPAILFLIVVALGTARGRHTVDPPSAPLQNPQQADSAEISEETPADVTNTKYRLDQFYYDGVEEQLGPFASYQFEGNVRTQSSTTTSTTSAPESNVTAKAVNASDVSSTTPATTVATSAAPVPVLIRLPLPQSALPASAFSSTTESDAGEDENEVSAPTTPFSVDSLGSVVKINNTEDESSEEQCDEAEVKKVKCNTCVCTDGVFFCSKKTCPEKNEEEATDLLDDIHADDAAVHLIMEKVVPVFGSTSNNKHIKNKYTWKKKQQPGSPAPLPDCTNGMTKTVDCNNCLCTKGKWHCTKSSCIALSLREKASYTDGSVVKKVEGLKENHHLDEDCLEGATREANCNQCVCHYNSWSCTNLPCSTTKAPTHIKEIEEACQVEGDVKSKECNICRCRRGVWVCTTNNCMVFGVAKIPYSPPKFRTESGKKP